MAAPGGPDSDTWKKMSRRERAVYWVIVGSLATVIAVVWLFM